MEWENLGGGVSRKFLGYDNQIMMVKVRFDKESVFMESKNCVFVIEPALPSPYSHFALKQSNRPSNANEKKRGKIATFIPRATPKFVNVDGNIRYIPRVSFSFRPIP